MQITIKATNLDLTPSLKIYIEDKLGTLYKFIEKLDTEGAVELRVGVLRTTKHHHKGDVFEAEANLILPGKMLRATHDDTDIHTSIDMLRNKLHSEIEKYKTERSPRRVSKEE